MKVFKITKRFRNGEVIKWLIVDDNLATEESVQDAVEYWAESDLNGTNYGYDLKWNEELSQEVIYDKIQEELVMIESEINTLQSRSDKLKQYQDKISRILNLRSKYK